MRTKNLLFVALLVLAVPCANFSQTVLFSDDFDTYTLGSYLVVSNPVNFTTWSGGSGGADDVKITDEQSKSQPHSVKIHASVPAGDEDIVWLLGNKTAGKYEIEFSIFVGAGANQGAYFNMLQAIPPSPEWAFSLVFDPSLDLLFSWNNVGSVIGTYAKGQWIDFKVNVNLDADSAFLWVDNVMLAEWQWSVKESGGVGLKQLAGVNFYAYAGGAPGTEVLYYIDDVKFTEIINIGISEPVNSNLAKIYPNPATDIINFDVNSIETVEIYSLTGSFAGVLPISNNSGDVSHLPAGVYLARIITAKGVLQARIVKE